ncbi:MAG TPA: protein-L-isoaspartate(D-aspartate) O-methyltransferase [Gammaproteobacteria bacterium]|nr:protein-L-isoaspartate(D-aspartate) O-methyltransferase [Gammaproteobacteria bacterium]
MKENQIRGIGMTSERTRGRLIQRLRDMGIKNEQVLATILNTPRHLFVDEALASRAYEDTALPIGQGQTISQPYIVARMTELLLQGEHLQHVLEVGTGCGYQTTILSHLVDKVYTVERLEQLLQQAGRRFHQLRLRNIRTQHSDGGWGWEAHAPYDGIIVTAAPTDIPEPLLQQLAPGARLVIPVGADRQQSLAVITRTPEGFEQVNHEAVTFVPLVRGRA